MTTRAAADTHAVIWYLYSDPRPSVVARSLMEDAAAAGDSIAVSAITLAEIVYLIDKRRIDAGAFDVVITAFNQVDAVLVETPFDRSVAQAMRSVDRAAVPDLPDRIVAATAVQLGVPPISRDGKIRMSGLTTIW